MSDKATRIRSSEPEVLIAAIRKAEPGATIITPQWYVTLGLKTIRLPI